MEKFLNISDAVKAINNSSAIRIQSDYMDNVISIGCRDVTGKDDNTFLIFWQDETFKHSEYIEFEEKNNRDIKLLTPNKFELRDIHGDFFNITLLGEVSVESLIKN